MSVQIPPEPPEGTKLMVTDHLNDSYIVYRDNEATLVRGDAEKCWFHGVDDWGIEEKYPYPMTWNEVWLQTVESGFQLHETGPELDARVGPEQMQDGKRYRVVLEGTCHYANYRSHNVNEKTAALMSPAGLIAETWVLEAATSIEEIGGDS